LLLWCRTRLTLSLSRLARLEEHAIATGQLDY
jgi:hypothetical protein